MFIFLKKDAQWPDETTDASDATSIKAAGERTTENRTP
jgi:hypothetical protein